MKISESGDTGTEGGTVDGEDKSRNSSFGESFPKRARLDPALDRSKEFVRDRLPIDGVRAEVVSAVRNNSVCIIVGETGSGKSTQIPKICLEEGLSGNGIIAVTEPRRVAAVTLAKRVSLEMNTTLGETVGYKVRFENVEGEETRILYATDGMLLREALYDSVLSKYSMVIVDEAHERSLHTDVLLYVLRLCCEQRAENNPIKLVIMSATLDAALFSEYFNGAPIFWVEGRLHNIDLYYLNSVDISDDNYVFNALTTVMQIHQEEPPSSGVLVFLTGQEEIDVACKKITEAARLQNLDNLVALPLYASLSPYAQLKVFEPLERPDVRKVVFATNIAETSVTIPGIRIVIDCGKIKTKTFLPDRRIEVLRIENVSKASATQRAGRAGREAPGKCYRLYAEKNLKSLAPTSVPEILRSNLATALLELYRIGMARVQKLKLISPPSTESIDAALLQLRLLEALLPPDKKERIFLSEMGTRLAAFPIDPSLARVLVASSENDCLEEALTVVSFMSSGDSVFFCSVSDRENCAAVRRKFEMAEGDHCTLLNVFRGFRVAKKERKAKEWCNANFVHERVLTAVVKIRKQLRKICVQEGMNFRSCGNDMTKLRKSLCSGMFMRACEFVKSQNSYRMLMSSNTSIKIHPSSCLASSKPTAFVFSELVRTNELYARDVTIVDIEWVKEILDSKKHLLKDL